MLADGVDLGGIAVRRRGFALLTRPSPHAGLGQVGSWLRFSQQSRKTAPGRRAQVRTALLTAFELDETAELARLDAQGRLRARLAAALAGEPRLLLLDDPLAGCTDAAPAIEVLRAVMRRGVTVLHATPRRDEAFALADRLVLLEAGHVLQAGTAAALYDRPDSLTIARRLGPANVLPGRIVAVENDVAVVRLDCGPVIEADPPGGKATADAPCQVLLRPERVSVSPLPPAELGSGAIAAVVREVTHMGDAIRLVLAIGTDADIVVMRSAAIGARGLEPGRTVSVAWQSRHALTFVGDAR
jgi:putative spermidine/putrescine transport system ATP-binding protein